MKFSIAIPSYNQAQFLSATLESVLTQSHQDAEFLVFDGGSNDGSVEILQGCTDARLSWVSRRDKGQSDAINQGLHAAKGDILAYLNSDDIYYPGTFEAVERHFRDNPDSLVVYGDAHHLYADGSVMENYYTERWNYRRLLDICYLCQPAVFWRREVMERFGTFDESLHFAMDYEYWLRVGKFHAFHYLEGQFLAGSRLHEDTKTLSRRVDVHKEIVKVVRRYSDDLSPVYRWLKHLAHYRAINEGWPTSQDPMLHQRHVESFSIWIQLYAQELQIPLDKQMIDEIAELSQVFEIRK